MISNELKSIVELIQSQGTMRFLEGASQEQISLFENNSDFVLPVQYKEWLLFSDGGEFFLPAGIQLYGVAHKPIIDVADHDRPNGDYCVIGALASGDSILCQKNGEQVSIYNREAGRIETSYKKSIGENEKI